MPVLFTVSVPPDPAPCHRAADGLRVTADAAGATADYLDTQVAMPREDFAGAAGRSYRTASGGLRSDVRLLVGDVRALAGALDDYASRITVVRRVLLRVREVALEQRLVVDGSNVVLPECPDNKQRWGFQMLQRRTNDAETAQLWACTEWERALAEHTGAVPADGPPLCTAPPPGWPPDEQAWPLPTTPPVGPVLAPLPDVDRMPVPPDPAAPVDRPTRPPGPVAPLDPVPPPAQPPAPLAPSPGPGTLTTPEPQPSPGPDDAHRPGTGDRPEVIAGTSWAPDHLPILRPEPGPVLPGESWTRSFEGVLS